MFTNQRGVSLVELIMFIVIVSIALAGVTLVMNQTGHSADVLLRKQALAASESLLEEIELHPFAGCTSLVTQANRTGAHCVSDYNNYTTGVSGVMPADGTTTAVAGLSNYNVTVAVSSVGLGNILAASAVQITVTVTDPAGYTTAATGYRTNY